MEIRSYRAVFDLERRIYRIDRLRLNPAGVPVRGVLYFLGLAVAGAMVSSLPVLSVLLGAAPWYMRELAIPAVAAAALTVLRIDGRPFHTAALCLALHIVRPRETLGSGAALATKAWSPEPLLMLPDGSDARMRRMRYQGPGAVLVATAHWRGEPVRNPLAPLLRSAHLEISQLQGRRLSSPRLIELGPGTRMQVR